MLEMNCDHSLGGGDLMKARLVHPESWLYRLLDCSPLSHVTLYGEAEGVLKACSWLVHSAKLIVEPVKPDEYQFAVVSAADSKVNRRGSVVQMTCLERDAVGLDSRLPWRFVERGNSPQVPDGTVGFQSILKG